MKKIFIQISLILTCSPIFSQLDVNESMAIEMAKSFDEIIGYKSVGFEREIEKVSLHNNIKNMWLIQTYDGWLLLSGTTKITPFLAYYKGKEKPTLTSLSPAETYLISEYEKAILYIQDSCKICTTNTMWNKILASKTLQSNDKVNPLLYDSNGHKFQWRQTGGGYSCDKQYNKYCPQITGNAPCYRAAAGCTAIAVAQILRYWKWPYSAYIPTTIGGNTFYLHFYDWDYAPYRITQSTPMNEVNMIAQLIVDCGYRLDIDYGESSGGSINDVPSTFTGFNYSHSAEIKTKWLTSNWSDMLKSELRQGRPIYYRGLSQSIGGEGHAFVVDGYNEAGLFSINLGWGYDFDTYYNLDNIEAGGTNFNHHQKAVIGIQPEPMCFSETFTDFDWYTRISVIRGGDVTLTNGTLNNIEYAQIYSNTQIRITGNYEIREGSNVRLAIKNIPFCNNHRFKNELVTNRDPNNHNDIIKDNRQQNNRLQTIHIENSNKHLSFFTNNIINNIYIYNRMGYLILTTNNTEIDISGLSAGIYIIIIQTDNKLYSEKIFVK